MKTSEHLCPIAFFIGQCFKKQRRSKRCGLDDLAAQLKYSSYDLHRFENGKNGLDALLILKLEKILQMHYTDYKPPVSYFGFLGLTACTQRMLDKTKRTIQQSKQHFQHPVARQKMEDSLLKLHYTPLRGALQNQDL